MACSVARMCASQCAELLTQLQTQSLLPASRTRICGKWLCVCTCVSSFFFGLSARAGWQVIQPGCVGAGGGHCGVHGLSAAAPSLRPSPGCRELWGSSTPTFLPQLGTTGAQLCSDPELQVIPCFPVHALSACRACALKCNFSLCK